MYLHVIRIRLCFQVEVSIKLIKITIVFAPLWIIMCPKSKKNLILWKGIQIHYSYAIYLNRIF
jgi:hypothetical protein